MVLAANNSDVIEHSLVSNGAGGVILAWANSNSGDDNISAQNLDGIGVPQWAANGIPIVREPYQQFELDMVPVDGGAHRRVGGPPGRIALGDLCPAGRFERADAVASRWDSTRH